MRDRILDPKFACAFLLDISSSQSDFEEVYIYTYFSFHSIVFGFRGACINNLTEEGYRCYAIYINTLSFGRINAI